MQNSLLEVQAEFESFKKTFNNWVCLRGPQELDGPQIYIYWVKGQWSHLL